METIRNMLFICKQIFVKELKKQRKTQNTHWNSVSGACEVGAGNKKNKRVTVRGCIVFGWIASGVLIWGW